MMDDLKLKKHSVTLWGHRTSITLEHIFWQKLKEISMQENSSLAKLIQKIEGEGRGNLSSAIRVFVLKWYVDTVGKE